MVCLHVWHTQHQAKLYNTLHPHWYPVKLRKCNNLDIGPHHPIIQIASVKMLLYKRCEMGLSRDSLTMKISHIIGEQQT